MLLFNVEWIKVYFLSNWYPWAIKSRAIIVQTSKTPISWIIPFISVERNKEHFTSIKQNCYAKMNVQKIGRMPFTHWDFGKENQAKNFYSSNKCRRVTIWKNKQKIIFDSIIMHRMDFNPSAASIFKLKICSEKQWVSHSTAVQSWHSWWVCSKDLASFVDIENWPDFGRAKCLHTGMNVCIGSSDFHIMIVFVYEWFCTFYSCKKLFDHFIHLF